MIATSWTGSERQRKSQGTCLPPKHPPNRTPLYTIPAGTMVRVRKVTEFDNLWRNYTTQIAMGFDRPERAMGLSLEFRHEGWLIRIPRNKVTTP